MATAAPRWKLLILHLAFAILVASFCCSAAAWSTSDILSVATDILEPSDDRSLDSRSSDPLLDSIDRHGSRYNKDPTFTFDNDDQNERFLVPMLSITVGDNNQFLEYMTAAVMARAMKRTLCLTPFFNGPIKHSGKHGGSLAVEDRYDLDELSKFVKVSSLDGCFQRCHRNIHGFWWLRHSSASRLDGAWTAASHATTHEFGRDFTNWDSINQIEHILEGLDIGNQKCVALGGLFPGLRWRGAYLAPSLFMRPSQFIMNLATTLQNLAIGKDQKFLAVHWRFEESLCNKKEIGTCFLRCGDGAVISSGLHATTRGLPDALKMQTEETGSLCNHMRDSTRVSITKEDIISAIIDKASKENVSSVYIATDGWMRGSHGKSLVREVVKKARSRGLSVSGLWNIKDLPNIIVKGGKSMDNGRIMRELSSTPLTGHAISMVEQELCFRASSFMGSGESTWSLAVFRARLAWRRRKQLAEAGKIDIGADDGHGQQDNYMIEQLLQDSHAAGLQCRYRSLYKSGHNVTEESYQDEAPDTWLDMEACEGRLAQGGSCSLFHCFA